MPTQEILDLDKNEQVILDIRRHLIGLYVIYFVGAGTALLLLVLLYYAIANIDRIAVRASEGTIGMTFATIIVLVGLFTYIASHVYKANQLVVTNENIIQVLQFSLFSRQVSQLNLAKIQDVSVDQAGIVETWLDFGTIEIETAGEAANFRFMYADSPNQVAKIIIEAHEDYIRRHPAGHNTYRI